MIHTLGLDKTIIENQLLVPCITKYLPEPMLIDIATRTAWLGNDETHYTRKWEKQDIEDLKELHKITQHYLLMAYKAKRYLDEMPDSPSKMKRNRSGTSD